MSVALFIAAAAGAQGVTSKASSPPPAVVAIETPRANGIDVAPPVAVMRPAPPPVVRRADYVNPYERPVTTVRIRAFAGGAALFDDQMRVGRSGANFNQNRSEAAEENCPDDYSATAKHSLSIGLRPDGPTKNSYRVNVSWSRPVAGCDGQGSRGVNVDQRVDLEPGQTVTVQGDGGLRVELTRR